MAIRHLITWGIGFSQDAGDWPKYQVTHGMDISQVVIPVITVKTYEGWLETKGPDATTA